MTWNLAGKINTFDEKREFLKFSWQVDWKNWIERNSYQWLNANHVPRPGCQTSPVRTEQGRGGLPAYRVVAAILVSAGVNICWLFLCAGHWPDVSCAWHDLPQPSCQVNRVAVPVLLGHQTVKNSTQENVGRKGLWTRIQSQGSVTHSHPQSWNSTWKAERISW